MTDPRIEDATGRAKEAVGALTGNDDLKASGEADQAAAKVHKTVDEVADAAKGAIDSIKDALT